ncbi:MAG: hypothetical protein L0241_01340 [Planctomycetia bacterium]|nr:hypothetical protein [Planctomycetia bacterium]
MRTKLLVAALLLASAAVSRADDGLTKGNPDMKSITSMTFGPKGILFVGDSAGAAIFAIDTGDTKPAGQKELNVEKLNSKIAAALGVTEKDVRITDMKVNPASGNVYLGVIRGAGAGTPAIVKIARADGAVSAVSLKDIPFAKVTIPNPAKATAKGPPAVITNMAFLNDKLYVAGLSSEEFASTLRVIPFPFKEADKGTAIEIYHGAHGAVETRAPIRTFVPYKVGKEDNIMAAYTCTPLVKIPVSELKPGVKVKGTTIAELGNRNNPLDMIVYTKDGKDYLLVINTSRGVMKIPTNDFGTAAAITKPVGGGATAGVKYESIKEVTDAVQLDKLNDTNALILFKNGDLKTIPMP